MVKIVVFEQRGGNYAEMLEEALGGTGENVRGAVRREIIRSAGPEFCRRADVFAAAPMAPGMSIAPNTAIRCKAAVLYGPDAGYLAGTLDCQRIVTYGTSQLDTVTVSSLFDGGAAVAVQREIKTLSDETVEIQELGFERPDDLLPLLFSVSAALVICGKITIQETFYKNIKNRGAENSSAKPII